MLPRRTDASCLFLVVAVSLLCVARVRGTALTSLQATCQTVADLRDSAIATGYVPHFKVMLYIHGTVAVSGTENELYTLSTILHFKNASNDFEFVPRRLQMAKDTGGDLLATYTFPFYEWVTDAGDITLSYEELPFQDAWITVNDTVHVTSFTLTCPLVSKTYLYNAHFWHQSTIAEFFFTRDVTRCDGDSSGTFDKSWFSYQARACNAGALPDDEEGCHASYPHSGSICATDLQPYQNNTMRWWCVQQTNVSAAASVETYYVRYNLAQDRICDKYTNASVSTLNTNAVDVFRQNNGGPGVKMFVRTDEFALGSAFTGFRYLDIEFSMPVNATLFGAQLYFAQFSYWYGLRSDSCVYYSDGGFPDGPIVRLRCDQPYPMLPDESPSVGWIGDPDALVYWALQNISTTDSSGAAIANYTSGLGFTTLVDGFPSTTFSLTTTSRDWVYRFGYVNTTALLLTVARPTLYNPKTNNIVCYDTDLGGRYNVTVVYRYQDTSNQFYVFFDEDSPLPDYAEDFIYCYVVFLGPETPTDNGVYMAIPLAVVPIPGEDDTSSTNDFLGGLSTGEWFFVGFLMVLAALGIVSLVVTYLHSRGIGLGYNSVLQKVH